MSVYESPGGNSVTATWRATADNGSDGSSGKASVYDLRYSGSPITDANWGAATQVPNEPTPGSNGASETCTFSVGSLTSVHVGLRIGDEVPNWSTLATSGPIALVQSGFTGIAPDDLATLGPSDAAPTFEFQRDPAAKPCYISFSGCDGFPPRPTVEDGEACRTLRFPLGAGVTSWTPSATQWTAIRKLVHTSGLLYWRLEGTCPAYGNVYGAYRTLAFDCGDISDLHVSPSHDDRGQEAVWPDRDVRPSLSWTNNTTGMARFLIDISKYPDIPLSDRQSTMTVGGRGVTGVSYTLNTSEWKRVRRLATWLKTLAKPDTADGVLYWRVRAVTADGALSCVSAAKILIVDGGEWTLGQPDLDPLTGTPRFSWSHAGDGIPKYSLEFCWDGEFTPAARETLKVPSGSITATSYTLKPGELTRLQRFMQRNGVGGLQWRVRGEDADRSFVTHSETGPVWP